MNVKSRFWAIVMMPGRSRSALRLSLGCASLALLSACASNGHQAAEPAGYFVAHAARDYNPPGPPNDPWEPYINAAATRFDVPATWIRQVMRVESGGHEYIDGQLTVSAAGAMGLMQLEPPTYEEMEARYGLGSDPFNPYDNIMAGAAYIHEMYQIYGSPGFLAAYNAGPGRLDSYVNGGRPLPQETMTYVAMIAPNIEGYYPSHRSEADQLALNTQPASDAPGILPPGFTPDAPQSYTPSPSPAPIQMAAQVPEAPVESAVFTPSQVAVVATFVPPPTAPAASSVFTPTQVAMVVPPLPPVFPQPRPQIPAPRPSFSIIQPAMADTLPPPVQPRTSFSGHQGWAIQVGAYDSSSNARAALGIAELSAVRMLVNGQPTVISIHKAGHVKYRARVVGLPHDDAVNACDRLSSGPTGCVVLSPDAQS